jgi:hypothetical protein
MITTYYKVLRKVGNKLYSCINNDATSIEYKLNETIKPVIKNSGLFVFDDINAAYKFIGYNDITYVVYEVTCENPRPANTILDIWFIDDANTVVRFWDKNASGNLILNEPPDRSYICDSLKLVKPIG